MVKTTILVESTTRKRIQQIGRKNQTYDEIMKKLIERQSTKDQLEIRFGNLNSSKRLTTSSRCSINNSNLIPETNNNPIREAMRCSAKATSKVVARLGSWEAIFLCLCENCKPRFSSTIAEQQDSEIEGNTNGYNKTQGESTTGAEEFDDLTYVELIQVTLEDLEEIEQIKKRRIVLLAKKLEALGTPKDMISQQISRDLLGRVNSSYVRACLGEEYKYNKQVRKHSTSQSRELRRADDTKKVLLGVTNEGIQENIKEQVANGDELNPKNSDPGFIESLQNKYKILGICYDYLAQKFVEQSQEFEKIERLKQIESANAEAIRAKDELQHQINALKCKISEQDKILAINRFEAYLEFKDQIIPVIIFIDNARVKAKVTVNNSKIEVDEIH